METADYVQVGDLSNMLKQMSVTPEDFLVLDLLKVVMNEHQVELSGIEGRIVIDKEGRLISPETCVADLEHGLEMDDHPVHDHNEDSLRVRQQLRFSG